MALTFQGTSSCWDWSPCCLSAPPLATTSTASTASGRVGNRSLASFHKHRVQTPEIKKDTTGSLVKHKKPHVNLIFVFNVHHFLNLYWICYTVLLLYYVLSFWLQAMWDLSFPYQGRNLGLNHWTAREVSTLHFRQRSIGGKKGYSNGY